LTVRDFARPSANGSTVLVQSDSGVDTMRQVRDEIAFLDPNVNPFNAQTLREYLDRSQAATRFSVQTYGGIYPTAARKTSVRIPMHSFSGCATAFRCLVD
jgi:hypothetical protein